MDNIARKVGNWRQGLYIKWLAHHPRLLAFYAKNHLTIWFWTAYRAYLRWRFPYLKDYDQQKAERRRRVAEIWRKP